MTELGNKANIKKLESEIRECKSRIKVSGDENIRNHLKSLFNQRKNLRPAHLLKKRKLQTKWRIALSLQQNQNEKNEEHAQEMIKGLKAELVSIQDNQLGKKLLA